MVTHHTHTHTLSLSHTHHTHSLSHTQEYEAELEMLQGQKKSYEAKMEEYEALQLQKKVTTHTLTHGI